MRKEKTIFDYLFAENICFSVVVSRYQCTDAIEDHAKHYTVIIHQSDLHRLPMVVFFKAEEYPMINMYDLSEIEIQHFKTINDQFVKIQHDINGSVWELKQHSFYQMYKKGLKAMSETA